MPGSVASGRPVKNASNAANPPADAPMPTTGNPCGGWSSGSAAGSVATPIIGGGVLGAGGAIGHSCGGS